MPLPQAETAVAAVAASNDSDISLETAMTLPRKNLSDGSGCLVLTVTQADDRETLNLLDKAGRRA
jgi:hypothetical protein